MPYTVYLLECSDGTYYTGVTTDMERRLEEHNSSRKGARYTRARRPVRVVHTESYPSRSDAQKREYVLRTLSRAEKEKLVGN